MGKLGQTTVECESKAGVQRTSVGSGELLMGLLRAGCHELRGVQQMQWTAGWWALLPGQFSKSGCAGTQEHFGRVLGTDVLGMKVFGEALGP